MNKIKQEDLLEALEELEGKIVIAEGVKDRRALKSLGVKNIILLNGRPLAELALHVSKSCTVPKGLRERERQKKREVVILTDFDSEGKKLAARLNYLLRKHRVTVNSRLRGKFMKFGKCRIEDFREGDIDGKTRPNIDKVRDKRLHKGKRDSGKAGRHRRRVRPD